MEKTTDTAPKKKFWRWGTNRWFVLGLIILGYLAARYLFSPVRPFVQLPAEHWMENPLVTLPGIGPLYLTNTMVALIIVMILVFILALSFRNAVRKGDMVLKGIPGALEALLEYLYNMTESTAGKWAWEIFPWFASITIMVLLANWMELIPGVDSIGVLERAETGGFGVRQLGSFFATIVNPAVSSGGYQLVPFVRTLSTDLNYTVALAIIVQIG